MNTPRESSMHATEGLSYRLARRLIAHASARTPPALRARLHEEWLADLAARRGLAPLRFALGCWWAGGVIGAEWHEPALATPRGTTIALPSGTGRRGPVVLGILALHVVLLYAFARGFIPHWHVTPVVPSTGTVVPTEHRPETVRPPPQPHLPYVHQWDPPLMPTVVLKEEAPVIQAPEALSEPTHAVHEPLAPAHVVQRRAGGPATGFPDSADFYPAASLRDGEAGVATVRACVDASGRLNAPPTIETSSGHERLDAGALALARAGSGHYRANAEDGKPVSGCLAFRVRFDLPVH